MTARGRTQHQARLAAVTAVEEARLAEPLSAQECEGLRAQEQCRLEAKRQLRAQGAPDPLLWSRQPRLQTTAPPVAPLPEWLLQVLIALLVFVAVGCFALDLNHLLRELVQCLPKI